MPLILDRKQVLQVYSEAASRRWVLPTFNAENLTTIEAILQATKEYGERIGVQDAPIIVGITNNYKSRPQSVYYTHTRKWQVGLRLFMNDLHVLTAAESPYAKLKVMLHLDHIQWDHDAELLQWDMRQFSSIMYDASTLPFDENIRRTREFVQRHGDDILIEGACDEIAEATGKDRMALTTPEMAERYVHETGVDIIVANLGTEHRASAANLKYHGDLAKDISRRVGLRLCLHGTSSVPAEQLRALFNDGIRKVNIWTALERDSSVLLFQKMLENASGIVGPDKAKELAAQKLLGPAADCDSAASIDFYTTAFRQEIVFEAMKEIVRRYLEIFYDG